MSVSAVVIIGAGHAGYQTAASLRQAGFDGSITLVNGEPGLPYQRPPLSKAYLLGELDATRLSLRQENWYATQDVHLLWDWAVGIDRGTREVRLESGTVLRYSHLVLATGARNRPLPVPGADLAGVFGMRTRADADAVARRIGPGARAVVVGAGFIGLEFAAVAAALDASVHVVDVADRPMARALSAPTSRFFRNAHEHWGVRFDFGRGLTRVIGEDGRVSGVVTTDGRTLPADLVVYGIGVVPNADLAESAGLLVADGIRVDEHLQTADPNISAVGDAVSFPCVHAAGARTRLESVQNAVGHGRTVAARLTGHPSPYRALPWFWSDQGDLKLQIAGLANGHDRTVELATPEARQQTVLCFRGDELVAVETVNRPGDHMVARRIFADPPVLTPSEAAADGFELKAWEQARRLSSAL